MQAVNGANKNVPKSWGSLLQVAQATQACHHSR